MHDNLESQEVSDWLLQLPEAALDCILQRLDSCSLASTAVTCSRLSQAVPATISTLSVRCRKDSSTLGSLYSWLLQHNSSLARLTKFSVTADLPTTKFGEPAEPPAYHKISHSWIVCRVLDCASCSYTA
jgi:hypothetical protein